MPRYGHALYDFEGDESQSELTFFAGDEVTITNEDAGDGWCEGSINGGPPGLIPASYIEFEADDGAAGGTRWRRRGRRQ